MTTQTVTTVLAAAPNYDLVDLPTVRDELNVKDRSKDSQLRRYISAASAAAAQFCNRVFPVETVEDVIDIQQDAYPWQLPGGIEVLQLSRWPVVAVTSVIAGLDTDPLVAAQDYRLNQASGQLLRLSSYDGAAMMWSALPVTVIYSGGFATVPLDVQDAVIRMIRTRWFAKDRDPMVREINIPGVLEQQFWVATGTDAGNMTPDVVDILENYRVPVIG